MRRQFSASVLLLGLVVSTNASAIQIVDTKRLTSDPADQYNPVISGDWVVFTDTRNGNADIYLYSLISGAETNITNDPANQLLNDVQGDFVVYSDYRSGTPQIYAYHIPSGVPCQLTFSTHSQLFPAIGGENVVFQDQNGVDTEIGSFDLSVLDTTDFATSCSQLAAGQLPGATTLSLGPGRQLSPKTSGAWVVYQGFNAQNQGRVFAYNRETLAITQMPESGKMQVMPDIDGARVVYIEDDGTDRDVVSYDLETQTLVQITDDNNRQGFPSISGNFIAFEDSRAGNLDVYLYDLSTGILTALTNDPANQYLNSLDDNRVVFTDASAGHLDVVLIEFLPDVIDPPDPCERVGAPTPIADVDGRTSLALDDNGNVVRRELIFWPFLSWSIVGGNHKHVDDHKRIVYDFESPSDVPQAMITLHAKLSRSTLSASMRAAGYESKAGLVLRMNGIERRWDDPANGVADVTVAAEKRYSPETYTDGVVTFDARIFRLPSEIAVTAGNAGNQWVSVDFGDVTCRYKGGSSQAHPSGWWQKQLGKRYVWQSCDDGQLSPGETFSSAGVTLHIENGDSHEVRTEVTLRLYADSSAGSDLWVDASFTTPVPLFAGHNRITLEGPGYGRTYLKYRKVDFANGGTLQAFTRPACVPDPQLLPACRDPNAEVLFAATDYVRQAGPLETVPFSYETTAGAAAVVCVENGDGDGMSRVTSAVIMHNGEPILGPSAFGAEISATAAPVITQAVNAGSVELRSAPGSFLRLRIVKAPPPPPPSPHTPETVWIRGCSQAGDGGGLLWAFAVFAIARFIRRRG